MSSQNIAQSRSPKWFGVGVLAVIAGALLIAIFANGSSPSSPSSTTSPTSPTSPSSPGGAGENQAVRVSGQVLPPLPEIGPDLVIGLPAPTLAGLAFDGSSVAITPGDGKSYMVVFLAHWCPHCNREVPRLIEWQQSGDIPADLQVIGVSTAVASDRPNFPPSQWVTDKGWPWPVMADSENMDAATAYGVSGFPFFVIVGPDGKVKVRASGELGIDELTKIVGAALNNLN